MENAYESGFAFILEGATELTFYDSLLHFFAQKHKECSLEVQEDPETFETFYLVRGPFGVRIIRMNAVGTITQIHNSASWFQNTCVHAKGKSIPWTVFLCYDTDSYSADVTKFHEDDWANFRKMIKGRSGAKKIIDLAVSADIEDVFLLDLHGISCFMGLDTDLKQEDIPCGRKGSARIKQLFIKQRQLGRTQAVYHKGERAKGLIELLDMQKILDSGILPFQWVEEIFKTE